MMGTKSTELQRYYDLCDIYEERFGERFWIPAGCCISISEGIFAIKSVLEGDVCRNGYEAFGLEVPYAAVR